MASNFLKRKVEERAKKQEIEKSSPAKSGGAETSKGKASSFLQKKAEESAEKTANLRAQWETDDRSHSSATKAQSSYKVSTTKTNTTSSPSYSMTQAEYDMRRASNPTLPEYGSYEYYKNREETLRPVMEQISRDTDRQDEVYKEYVRIYDAGEMPAGGDEGIKEKARRLSQKFKYQDAVIAEYKDVMNKLNKYEGEGIHYTEEGEFDTSSGTADAEGKRKRYTTYLNTDPLTAEEVRQGGLGNLPKDRQAVYDETKGYVDANATEKGKIDLYEYYDSVKDNQYTDDFWGQSAANYRASDIGINTNIAYGRVVQNPTEANEELAEAWEWLSGGFQDKHENALDNEGAVLPWISRDFAGYLPQVVDRLPSQIVGGATGGFAGSFVGQPLKGVALGAGVATTAHVYPQLQGQAYQSLIEIGIDEKTARKFATDEAFVSSLIEGGDAALNVLLLGFGSSLSAVGNSAARAVAKGSTNVVTKMIAKLAPSAAKATAKAAAKASAPLWKKGVKTGGKLVLNALGEYVEEATQKATSIANLKRAAQGDKEGGIGNLALGATKTTWDAVTGKDKKAREQMHEAGGVGFRVGLLGGGTTMMANKIVTDFFNKETIQEQNEYAYEILRNGKSLDALIEQGKASGEGSVSAKVAKEVESSVKKGRVTRDQVKRLIQAIDVYIQDENSKEAKSKAVNIKSDDSGRRIVSQFLNNKPAEKENPLETARKETEARATEAAYNAGKANVPMDKAGLATPAQVEAYNAGRMESIKNMGTEKPMPTKQSKVAPVTYETLEALSKGNETIDVEDVKRVTGFGEEGSKMVADLANKDGVTFSQAKRMVESSYLAGYSQDDVARGYVKTDTQRAAFAAGEKDRLADYSAKVEESKNATIHKGVFTENEYSKNLTSAERTMFSTIAKDLKMDIAMVDKIIVKFVEGKREIRREANASHEKGKMRISSTSELPMVSLAVHEGSHRMRNLDPESFDALMNFIYATSDQQATALQYGGIGESLFDQIHDDYSGVKGMDTGAYIEEIVAKRLETIFSDAEEFNNWRKTIDANPQMKSNWQKFCEWFKKVLEDMWASITNSKMDLEAKRQAQAEIERIKSLLSDAYKGAMNAAEERAQDTNSRSTETPKHSLKKGDGRLSAEEQKAVDALGEGAKVTTNSNGEMLIATNKDKSTVMYSWKTYEDGGKEALRKALKANGHTAAEIEETLSWVDDAGDYLKILAAGYAKSHNYTALSNHLIADVITNVKTGKQVLSAIVNNGEYPVNIDLALICKKRIAYMNLMTRLIDDGVFDKVNYGGEAIAKVNALLRADGFETACLGCFVESRRLQFQAWAETIVSEWNTEVDKRTKNAGSFNFAEGKANLTDAEMDSLAEELKNAGKKNAQGNLNLGQGSVQEKMGRLLDKLPSLRKHLTVADLLKPEGLTALRAYDSSLFSLVKSRYGAASPKIVQDYNPYASEIAMITFASVKNITSKSVKGAEAYRKKVISDMGGKPVKQKDETVKAFKERKAEFDAKVEDEAIRRYLYDIGGARIQSFSDFMIENVFDYIQIFADLSAKRLPLHGYTKEIIALRLFGMTGAKWNGSWIAHVDRSMGKEYAGLLPASEAKNGNAILVHTEDGDFAIGFDDYARHKATNKETFIQSVGMKDMIALQLDPRYSPHVGSITIGVSDKHILAMLDSPHFRFVIPYHASGMLPQFAKLVGVDLYNDYTKYQNTTVKQWYDAYGNPCEPVKDVDVDTSYNFNAEVQKTGDAKKAADNYLKWCAQKHPVYKDKERIGYVTFKPKFSDSPYGTDFSSHENYYKLLEDFNSYDNITEESAVQGAVAMTFPSEQNRLTASEMEAYKARLRETGLFSEEEIEKYATIADKTFKELIADEVKGRAEYQKAQTPKWESTVKSVEDMLLAEHKRDTSPTQYSFKDSDGKTLTEEQAEFFKDSKARDKDSNLLVMYHGTSNGGHYNFDTYDYYAKFGLFGNGAYFTDNKDIAESYTSKGRGNSPQVYTVYLNITNPIDMDAQADVSAWNDALRKTGEDFSLLEGEMTNETAFKRMVEELGYFEVYSYDAAEIVRNVFEYMGYNGITHVGGGRVKKSNGIQHRVFIAFEPEQIKLTTNETPTNDPDIRYSLKDQEYLELARDPEKNEARLREMVDEAAYTKNYIVASYHGTPNGGFTRFGGHKTRNGAKPAGVYWFTDDYEHARVYKSYPQNYPEAENPMIYNVFLDLGEWADIGNGRTEAIDYSTNGAGLPSNDLKRVAKAIAFKTQWKHTGESERARAKKIADKLCAIGKEIYADFVWQITETEAFAELCKSEGLDSVVAWEAHRDFGTPKPRMVKTYGVFSKEQVKSADLVTYDDNGNIIPLSERFNNDNDDIRYSRKNNIDVTPRRRREFFETVEDVKNGKKGAVERLAKYVDGGMIRTEEYDELVAKYGAIPYGENPSRDIRVPRKTAKNKKVSQTVRTILEAKVTPDEAMPTIEKMVEDGVFSYDVYTDKQAIKDSEDYLKGYGWMTSYTDWMADVEKGIVSKQHTVMGWALYNNAINRATITTSETERRDAMETALTVLDAMVRHQRNAAQALQATRVLKTLSPESQLYAIQKSVDSFQKDIDRRYGKKAPKLKVDEDLAGRFVDAKTEEERMDAEKEIYKDIGRQMPSNWLDKWNAWRYVAMLSNPRTHIRNTFGNAFFAPVVITKDLFATAIESAAATAARKSGKDMIRTKSFVWGNKADRALLEAAWNDYANVADIVSNGGKYNDFAIGNTYIQEGRNVFKWKPLEAVRRGNSKLLEVEDIWFSKPHYAYALAQYCKANNITAEQIANGKAIAPAREYAVKEAQKATYKDINAFSQMVSDLGRRGETNWATNAKRTFGEAVLPFRRTPANILVRGVEYSPLGLLKGLWNIHKVGKETKDGRVVTASDVIDGISAGMTGTALFGLGVFCAAQGLVRGHGEEEKDEKEFKELTGHQNYSLELPSGGSITLDWLAPESLPFFTGVSVWEMAKGKEKDITLADVQAAISGISDPMLEMSFLQGLNDTLESIGYAKSNEMKAVPTVLATAAASYLSQGIPTLFGQIERTGEDVRMTTYTEKDSFFTSNMQYSIGRLSAKIPFVDYNQIPYIDAWGRKEASGTALKRGLNNFLNPAYTSTINESGMEKELLRLYKKTGEASVFPSRAGKYFMVDGVRKDLSADEYVRYATMKGEKSYKFITELVNSKAYKNLTDEEKVHAIEDAYTYADQKAKSAVSAYKPESWVGKADKFGTNAGNYIAFRADVSSTRSENGGDISKQEVADIITNIAQNEAEEWLMYLSMYGGKSAAEAEKHGINMESFANFSGAVAELETSEEWKSYSDEQKELAKKDLAYMYTTNEKDWLFLMGTEYSSYKKRKDYIGYFGE